MNRLVPALALLAVPVLLIPAVPVVWVRLMGGSLGAYFETFAAVTALASIITLVWMGTVLVRGR